MHLLALLVLTSQPLDAQRLGKLFGFHGLPPPPAAAEVPLTPLPLRLLGTLRGETSLAAITTNTRTLTVSVGDVVLGVEIVSIEQSTVIVRRDSRLERLGFGLAPPPTIGPPRLTRELVRQTMLNPTSLLQDVRMMPVFADGKWSGVRAIHVADGSLVASLGLKRGDVLRAVNGVPLDNLERVMNLYQQLSTTRRFDVELERNGQRRIQTVSLDD